MGSQRAPSIHLPRPSKPELVCDNPALFPRHPSTSSALPNMALADEAKRVAAQFDFTDADLNAHVQEFLKQMGEGLEKDGTSMSQIPTYVTGVPNGTEKGLYLAVDLGGINFRVCSVTLNGDTTFNLTYNKVAIPKELMVADKASKLFAFLALQIENFLKEHHSDHFESHRRRRATISTASGYKEDEVFHLGFTFSFPVQQQAINKGTLMRWTKGFDIDDAVGKGVCALLQTEIDKLKLPVKVAALVNDTVGTLMARSYTSTGAHRSTLGAIFGTGTNGAYIEKTSNIKKKIEGEYDESTGEMVTNTDADLVDTLDANLVNRAQCLVDHVPEEGVVLDETPVDANVDHFSLGVLEQTGLDGDGANGHGRQSGGAARNGIGNDLERLSVFQRGRVNVQVLLQLLSQRGQLGSVVRSGHRHDGGIKTPLLVES